MTIGLPTFSVDNCSSPTEIADFDQRVNYYPSCAFCLTLFHLTEFIGRGSAQLFKEPCKMGRFLKI